MVAKLIADVAAFRYPDTAQIMLKVNSSTTVETDVARSHTPTHMYGLILDCNSACIPYNKSTQAGLSRGTDLAPTNENCNASKLLINSMTIKEFLSNSYSM